MQNNKLKISNDMLKISKNFSAQYNSKEIESNWYKTWIENDCFKSQNSEENSFCVLMPPPNVTGILHMGHVLNNTLQDIVVRWERIKGKNVLWIPGTDHAGIATQTKVEKALKSEGIDSKELSREQFLERAGKWRDEHGGIILQQLKRLGVSCDWSRLVHTLDEDYSKAVLTAFVKLYKKGYIYKGNRLVNWCPSSLTALSDEEVVMKETSGKLYTVKYAIAEEPGKFIEIATTRPETIMGDTAIAVNPKDERYKKLVGKHCIRPFSDTKIPIIADEAVEIDFGTGALKITPAHDQLDFEIGQRHKLDAINVLSPSGTINENGGEFEGLDRFDARKAVVEKLRGLGILLKEEEHENRVGFSERANVPIEPRLSEQWFLRYPKVEEAKEVVKSKLIKFWPERWVKVYLHWLDNIKDWCISRQLLWGHRIPVWYRKGGNKDNENDVHVSVDGPKDFENWEQDNDVLDTWFASWLWPIATLGWPDEKEMSKRGFQQYFPTGVLVTGPDILFFWATRMIIACLEFLPNEDKDLSELLAFKNVYLTGIIRDSIGRKMSKSLGNSPDPLDLMDKYGADGVRLGLISISPQGQDICFDEAHIVHGRNACTKLWNSCRFRQMQSEGAEDKSIEQLLEKLSSAELSSYDQFILLRLKETMQAYEKSLAKFDFNATAKLLQSFFRNDFCDWYLEVSKSGDKSSTLLVQDICLRQLLLMFHPFIPFITEELWHQLNFGSDFIQNYRFCSNIIANAINEKISDELALAEEINEFRNVLSEIRSLKAQFGFGSCKEISVQFQPSKAKEARLDRNAETLRILSGLNKIEKVAEPDGNNPAIVTDWGTVYLLLSHDIDLKGEREKLLKELKQVESYIKANKNKLQNKKFVQSAPEAVVKGAEEMLKANELRKVEIERLLNWLK